MIKFQVAEIGSEEGRFGDWELALFPCGPEHETLEAAREYMYLHARGYSSKDVCLDDYVIRIVDREGRARREETERRRLAEEREEEERREAAEMRARAQQLKEEEEDELQAKWDRARYGG